jgi:multidrug efflux pump subunit AcrB
MGKNHHEAAREGTDEIGLAVMATTFAIVAVFVPIAFMSGLIGRFFFQFGVTVAVAVLVSLFVSFTLDPDALGGLARSARLAFKRLALARSLHGEGRAGDRMAAQAVRRDPRVGARSPEERDRDRPRRVFLQLRHRAARRHRVRAAGGRGVHFAALNTPVGSSLEYTDSKVQQVEAALKVVSEIALMMTTVGSNEGRNYGRVNLNYMDRAERKRTQRR